MMTKCFRAKNGKVAIWEKPVSGDKFAPFNNPMAYLSAIYFHSDLNYYGVAAKDLAKVINHAAVAATVSYPTYPGGPSYGAVLYGQIVVTTHSLIVHNLGYVPKFFVAANNKLLPQGIPLQQEGDRARFISAYATTTEIRLREVGMSSDAALSSVSLTYQVLVFRDVAADPALPLLSIKPDAVILDHGKFRNDQGHLRQVGNGESPFGISTGPCSDVRNGGVRTFLPGGDVYTYGSYTGSAVAPASINLAV
jgi:hypothetical protein